MPVLCSHEKQLSVGAYYVNRRSGVLVEIVEVSLSGNCRVLDARAPLDAEPMSLTESQIRSALWRRVKVDAGDGDQRLAA
jgi:hypothetical protein